MPSHDLIDMDLMDIAMLVEMGNGQNLGQIAEVLGLSASAVSHRLKRLQDRMPLAITRRVGREIVVTESIEAAIPYLTAALENLRDAVTTITEPTTRVALVGIARILSGWAETLLPAGGPDGSALRWTIHTGTSEDIVDQVRHGMLDCGLVRTDHGLWGVTLHALDQDPLVPVATPSVNERLSPGIPDRWPWIHFSDSLSHGQTVNQIFSQMRWNGTANLKVDALESALALVLVGRGVAVLPESLVAMYLETSRLRVVPTPDVRWPTRTVALVTRAGRELPPWFGVWGDRIKRRLHHGEST